MIRLRRVARANVRAIAADLEERSASPSIRWRFSRRSKIPACYMNIGRASAHVWDMAQPGASTFRRFVVRRFPNYPVFYRESKDGILIERVVHGVRDLPLFLNG